jgi:antitoxin component YwqK of YwqJK toxin-antitoxin module
MVRSVKWMSSVMVGLLLAWESTSVKAQPVSPQAVTPAGASETAGPAGNFALQYVADLPTDEDGLAAPGTDIGMTDEVEESKTPRSQTPELVKERFPNGKIRIKREVTQDAQGNYVNHGGWKLFDEQGNLLAQGQFNYGERNGVWVRWYRGVAEADLLSKMPYQQAVGPFISQATFKNGRLDGTWIIYDHNMRKVSQWSFADGKRHGLSTWWYGNGRKMREIEYRDGDADGRWTEWSPSGSALVKDFYQAGRKLGVKTVHHANGKKKSEGMYLFAKELEKTPDDWWHCKPQVTAKQGPDERHGAWASWFPNGERQQVGQFEHGVQVGPFIWWHVGGKRALEGRFVAGKQDGEWIWYYRSGQKSIRGEYVHGNPTGRWTWWKEDGKVAQSADLSNGESFAIDPPPTLETPAPPRAVKQASPRANRPLPMFTR